MTPSPAPALRDRILRFLAEYPSQMFKPVEIARRLSINGETAYAELLGELARLHTEGHIARAHRKRYGHAIASSARKMKGIFSTQRQGPAIVNLLPPGEGTVLIASKFSGTALHGDTVEVALFAHRIEKDEEGEDILQGEVVGIVSRSEKPIVGTFQKSKHFFFVIPDDNRIGKDIYIAKGATMGARPGQKVVVRIVEWNSRNLNPEGAIAEVLGKSGEVRAEMMSVIRQFKLSPHFPKEVVTEADRIPDTIPESEIQTRLDLRGVDCLTIDPEDAKDFDDAISIQPQQDGNFLLGVHIADVSHYVREKTHLDQEALRRGTSVYLANEVIPMLPESLSNNICSLRPDEDRLTYSAMMTVSPKGAVLDYDIVKSVIRSKRRFTYEEVQKIIESGKGPHRETIKLLHTLSQTLLKKRMKEGSIDFESSETKFRFDAQGKPTEIIKKLRLDAHRLVEEFMLLANQVVAKHIGLAKKEQDIRPFIYRIHDLPDPDRLQDLAAFVERLGFTLSIGGGVTSRALQKLLQDVKGKDEENVINEIAVRSMAKAIYSETNIGHFGLGFKYYTHFTSPIRRYPDLMIHRLLHEYERAVPHKRREQLLERLPDICKQSSDMERVAMEAERASVKVMQVEYMRRHVGDEFHALISGVTNFGLFVEITDLLVQGLIRVRDLGDDYYVYDEKHFSLIGRRTKKRYRLGDKVQVKVVRVDPEEREIDFALVE
jgi:ribonuclease R